MTQFMLSDARPTPSREAAIASILQKWVQRHGDLNRTAKYPKRFPRQIRELFRVTDSRAARKAMEARYMLTEAQWVWLYAEWLAYIESLGMTIIACRTGSLTFWIN